MLIIDRNVLAERRRLVEADLAENGFDALVLYAQGSSVGSASKSHGYMSFLTDWDSYNTPGVLVLVPGKPPVLFVANIFLKYMTEQTWWLDDVRFAAPPVLAAEVARALEERCGACRKIAYIGRGETPVPFWEGLRAATGAAEYAEYESRVDPLRVVKDPVQYSIHYRGAEICDAMFQELRREIRQGKPVYQLQNAMIRLAHDSGAEHALVWLTVGPAAEYCHFRREECQRVPQIGDQVLVGIYLLYHGHWAHALRMGTYGAPSPAQQRAFDIVLEMENAGLEALRPGGNLYDVHHAFERVYRKHFSERDDAGVFRFRAAHGLGHSYEDPITSAPFLQPYTAHRIEPDAFLEIRPGMLFEFHPNFFQKGVAGGAVGDMIHVGEHGNEIMTAFPRQSIRWDR